MMLYRAQSPDQKHEQSVFLTHTGITNEAGVVMQETIGRFAYNFVCIPVENELSLALLCSDSLQIEELSEFVDFWFSNNGEFDQFTHPEAPSPALKKANLSEWLLINKPQNQMRHYNADETSKSTITQFLPAFSNSVNSEIVSCKNKTVVKVQNE